MAENFRCYDLNYYDEKFLALYRQFYGFEYAGNANNDDNAWEHFTAQNLLALLKLCDVQMGNYGFCWWESQHGPRSTEFEQTLVSFDFEPDLVRDFYKNLDIEKYETRRVKDIRSIVCDSCPQNIGMAQWIDILTSVYFVKSRVSPYEEGNFEAIKHEVVSRRHELFDNKCLGSAWQASQVLDDSLENDL